LLRLVASLALLLISGSAPLPARLALAAAQETKPLEAGAYRVEWARESPARFSVEADLPIDGQTLEMATTRPGGIPELDADGWTALIQDLRVSDAQGAEIEATSMGPEGWKLARPSSGRIHLSYAVDFSALEALGWPAPREAVWSEDGFLQLVGRSLFITAPALGASTVTFVLPTGWRAVTAWDERPGSPPELAVGSAAHLTENLVVLMQSAPDVVESGGFRLLVAPTAPWFSARSEVRRVLEAALPHLVGLLGVDERSSYLVSLLPLAETGGESYRSSFASTFEETPSRANSSRWANTIAHEVFHQWNGWRLRGADYASTQWFHEGFTEYAANVSLVAAGLVTPEEFLAKLAEHVQNRERLTTSLEDTGGHKGPPLYSAGALVAFTWDVQIRHASQGERSLWDFMRTLWEQTGRGQWPYEWKDLESALDATAKLDWAAFRRAHIAGTEPLPLDSTLALAGMRLETAPDGAPQLVLDPSSSEVARALWQDIVSGR
jgi:M61 glycyl aminopeptidase/Peptidase M61 N-terminal domain